MQLQGKDGSEWCNGSGGAVVYMRFEVRLTPCWVVEVVGARYGMILSTIMGVNGQRVGDTYK